MIRRQWSRRDGLSWVQHWINFWTGWKHSRLVHISGFFFSRPFVVGPNSNLLLWQVESEAGVAALCSSQELEEGLVLSFSFFLFSRSYSVPNQRSEFSKKFELYNFSQILFLNRASLRLVDFHLELWPNRWIQSTGQPTAKWPTDSKLTIQLSRSQIWHMKNAWQLQGQKRPMQFTPPVSTRKTLSNMAACHAHSAAWLPLHGVNLAKASIPRLHRFALVVTKGG